VVHHGRVLPNWFEAYVGLESEAVRLRDFQSMVMLCGTYVRRSLRRICASRSRCSLDSGGRRSTISLM